MFGFGKGSGAGALGACLLALGLGACDSKIGQAEDKVREAEKDPDAAKFRNVKECPTGFYVTGEVNGKNSYGAYAGFKTFYANSAEVHIVDDDELPDITDRYVKMCNSQAEVDRMANISDAILNSLHDQAVANADAALNAAGNE